MKNKGLRFSILLLITLSWMFLMRKMTYPLDTGSILKFEFIGTAEKARLFLNNLAWLDHTELMTLSIYLDFIFPLLYGAAFFYGSAWVCSKIIIGHPLNKFKQLARMILIAVVCDFLENISLLQLIYLGPNDTYAGLAFLFAGIKFLLLTLVFIHFLLTLILSMKGRQSAEI